MRGSVGSGHNTDDGADGFSVAAGEQRTEGSAAAWGGEVDRIMEVCGKPNLSTIKASLYLK